jgi:hypothetical protein
MRAVGGVGAAQASLADRVYIESVPIPIGDKPVIQLNYNYDITGLDFGLQKLSQLVQTVQGSCITEYNWLSSQDNTGDYYSLWNMPNQTFVVARNEEYAPPWAAIYLHPVYDRFNWEQFIRDCSTVRRSHQLYHFIRPAV